MIGAPTVTSARKYFLIAIVLLLSSALRRGADAQAIFYNEVAKDGRIYVFADWSKYDAFIKSGSADIDASTAITRPGYGPHGETIVFDSENAVNLYNFKHGLPGEHFAKSEEQQKRDSGFPAGKISGLMFGDDYWYYRLHQDRISSDNPTEVQGQQGFWFRRLYLTYDLAYNEKLSTRFRLEANSDGQFAGGDLVPYVKDAYLKWTYAGKHQMTLGIHPSLTFDWLEGFWGLRHIEKTPADLYRIDSSRDFGVTLSGPLAVDGLNYAGQFGNESGNGSETDDGKIVRFEGRFERTPGIAVEGFYSYSNRAAGRDRQTAQGFAGFRTDTVRAGGHFLWQERQSGVADVPSQTISIWSGFVVWDVLPKKADLFLRVDRVAGHLGGAETGLPGAEEIDYWLMSSRSKFTTWIVGGEWYLHPSIRVSPNLELADYAHDPDPVNFPGRDQDAIVRLTFFWMF
jgi:hypothetical protein